MSVKIPIVTYLFLLLLLILVALLFEEELDIAIILGVVIIYIKSFTP